MGFSLPPEIQRAAEKQSIAQYMSEAKPFNPDEFAEFKRMWLAPGIHQHSGARASVVYRLIATIEGNKRNG